MNLIQSIFKQQKHTACLIIILVLFSSSLSAQEQSTESKKSKYIFAFLPSKAHNMYGLALGPVGSESLCAYPYQKTSSGLNIQIPGQGLLLSFTAFNPPFKTYYKNPQAFADTIDHSKQLRSSHNGLVISVFGTTTHRINGISLSPWISGGKIMNGLSVNLLWNLYHETKGVSIACYNSNLKTKGIQIGLVNKTIKLKGFQFGLWNKNEKRSFPLINWNFRD